jgi:hypothetical protein
MLQAVFQEPDVSKLRKAPVRSLAALQRKKLEMEPKLPAVYQRLNELRRRCGNKNLPYLISDWADTFSSPAHPPLPAMARHEVLALAADCGVDAATSLAFWEASELARTGALTGVSGGGGGGGTGVAK